MKLFIVLIGLLISLNAFGGEATYEVKIVIVKMPCDMPGFKGAGCSGHMKVSGQKVDGRYPHICTGCKARRAYPKAYPEVRRLEIKK